MPTVQILVILLMLAVAYMGVGGICIVPAFGAMLLGCSAQWGGAWRYRPASFVAGVGLSALAGVATVHFVPELWCARFFVAWNLVVLLSLALKVKLPPLFSVALLPVFLASDRWTYVVIAVAYAVGLMMWHRWGVLGGDVEESLHKEDVDLRKLAIRYGLMALAFVPLCVVAKCMQNGCFLLPCLAFAFAEWTEPRNEDCAVGDYTQVSLAALLGVVADGAAMAVVKSLLLPDFGSMTALVYVVACLPALVLLLGLSKSFKRLFLPSVAIVLFPFLRDAEIGYVLAVNLSSIYLLMCAKCLRRWCAD